LDNVSPKFFFLYQSLILLTPTGVLGVPHHPSTFHLLPLALVASTPFSSAWKTSSTTMQSLPPRANVVDLASLFLLQMGPPLVTGFPVKQTLTHLFGGTLPSWCSDSTSLPSAWQFPIVVFHTFVKSLTLTLHHDPLPTAPLIISWRAPHPSISLCEFFSHYSPVRHPHS